MESNCLRCSHTGIQHRLISNHMRACFLPAGRADEWQTLLPSFWWHLLPVTNPISAFWRPPCDWPISAFQRLDRDDACDGSLSDQLPKWEKHWSQTQVLALTKELLFNDNKTRELKSFAFPELLSSQKRRLVPGNAGGVSVCEQCVFRWTFGLIWKLVSFIPASVANRND